MENKDYTKQTQSDHDLLIRIDEKLSLLILDTNDHEKRIRAIETTRWMIMGGASVLSVLANYVINFLL